MAVHTDDTLFDPADKEKTPISSESSIRSAGVRTEGRLRGRIRTEEDSVLDVRSPQKTAGRRIGHGTLTDDSSRNAASAETPAQKRTGDHIPDRKGSRVKVIGSTSLRNVEAASSRLKLQIKNGAETAAEEMNGEETEEKLAEGKGKTSGRGKYPGIGTRGTGSVLRLRYQPKSAGAGKNIRSSSKGRQFSSAGHTVLTLPGYRPAGAGWGDLRSTGRENSLRNVGEPVIWQAQTDYGEEKENGRLFDWGSDPLEEAFRSIAGAVIAAAGGVFLLLAFLTAVISSFLIIICCLGGAKTTGSSSSLDANAAAIYEAFHEMGLGDVQIAAILGNMYQETHLDPTLDVNGAIGLMMWTGPNRTAFLEWMEAEGYEDWTDIDAQCHYAYEVSMQQYWAWPGYTGEKAYPSQYNISYEDWLTTEDVDLATGAFCACCEKPYYHNYLSNGQDCASLLDTVRIPKAEEYLELIQSGDLVEAGYGEADGYEVINDVPYFNQGNYKDIPFSSGTVSSSGCGICSFAMIAAYYGVDVNMRSMAAWSMANNANTAQNTGAFQILCDHYGLTLDGYYTGPLWGGNMDGAFEGLNNGALVVLNHDPGYWTSYGHYVVLTGKTEDGKYYINDPGSIERTYASPYDYSLAFSTVKQYWVISD